MNKRIRKKNDAWSGSKGIATGWCASEILMHIIIKCKYYGIKPNMRNIKKYIRWFYYNSSQTEWDRRVADAWQVIHRNRYI